MIKRYLQLLGLDETKLLLEANERPLIPSIRVNTLKITVENLKEKLLRKGCRLESIEGISYGFRVLKAKFNLGATHEYLQGYYYLQNLASMIPAVILDPKELDVVIDMCAAPGSKSTQIAQLMINEGKLILIDRNIKRIPKLEINLRRMGVENSIIINMDARNLKKLNLKANKILLDAPCTGEGLIRQDPTRKSSKTINDIKKMASIQKDLLKSGLESLKPGGQLVYSTCSIAPEEDELVIDQVLDNNPDYSILEINNNFGINGYNKIFGRKLRADLIHSKRLFPHIDNTIGFFVCLIQRNI